MQAGRRCPPIFPKKKKKPVYVNDWERSRKELLIAHSPCVMRAILCNWQCGLIVEALYSTMNLPNPACMFVVGFFFILHLIAYLFLQWQCYLMETKYDKWVNKQSVVSFKLTGALKSARNENSHYSIYFLDACYWSYCEWFICISFIYASITCLSFFFTLLWCLIISKLNLPVKSHASLII